MKKEELPIIFEYNNFRIFLDDYQKARYKIDREFSRIKICKRLGLPNSRSYFNDIVKGKKLTPTYTERFIEVLELSGDEALFFQVLVKFNQADNTHERELYFEQLISLNHLPKRKLEKDVFEYFKEWHHSAIRAIIDIGNFDDDYKELAKYVLPKISPNDVKNSIELLKKLSLIEKDSDGFYRQTERMISTGDSIKNELIKQHQLNCLETAKKILIKEPPLDKKFITKMVSVSEEGYARIEKKIKRCMKEISTIVHKDDKPADRVYQLNLQLFPGSDSKRES